MSGKLALGARGYLVGGLLVLAVAMASFAPARQAGAQFLRLFRVQNVAVIPFEPEAALRAGGKLEALVLERDFPQLEPTPVADLVAAEAQSGEQVLQPGYLPDGFSAVEVAVAPAQRGRVVLNLSAARSMLAAAGLPTDALPMGLEEATLFISVPPLVLVRYAGEGAELTYAQLRSPQVEAPEWVDERQLAELGLRLLGLSAPEAASLASSIDWASTLVIPIPRDEVRAYAAHVRGQPGYLLEEVGAAEQPRLALIWQEGGLVRALAGALPASELMAVAESLR